MGVDLKFVELAADVLEIFVIKNYVLVKLLDDKYTTGSFLIRAAQPDGYIVS